MSTSRHRDRIFLSGSITAISHNHTPRFSSALHHHHTLSCKTFTASVLRIVRPVQIIHKRGLSTVKFSSRRYCGLPLISGFGFQVRNPCRLHSDFDPIVE
ncbi:unnamed protein product [Lactuca virosa]|uniref:Uncharacterized protein n=1 Tax=Lactuca virosa TaxID=75947 RepID=A0AAU9MP31_9ASTR|nr:unnamed protein product [Lactuca virosa]